MNKKALILVDIQNDFMPGGALAVQEGDQILPIVQHLIEFPFDLIIASLDWHPLDHSSFASQWGKKPGERIELAGLSQILWPDHCVKNTQGAAFSPGWDTRKIQRTFHKGEDREIDSYSTFYDNGHRKSTGLGEFLKNQQVREVFLAGLATDYCVKYSALDALKLGFHVSIVIDACRAVNLKVGDEEKAFEEMRLAGAHLVESTHLSF